MFRLLKNLFGRQPQTTVANDHNADLATAYVPAADYSAGSPPSAPRHHATPAQSRSRGVQVSLQGILANLPIELQPCVLQSDVGSLSITVPLEKVLAQLSRGTVKVPFGEVRHAAPSVFTNDTENDKVLVMLPLSEIVPRLNPALIQRRRVQKQVDVPEDISSPFDQNGQALIFSVGPSRNEPAKAPPAAAPSLSGARKPAPPAAPKLNQAPAPKLSQPGGPKLASEQQPSAQPGRLSYSLAPKPAVTGEQAKPAPGAPAPIPLPSNLNPNKVTGMAPASPLSLTEAVDPISADDTLITRAPVVAKPAASAAPTAPGPASMSKAAQPDSEQLDSIPAPIAFKPAILKPSATPITPIAPTETPALKTPAASAAPQAAQKPAADMPLRLAPAQHNKLASTVAAPVPQTPQVPVKPVETVALPLARVCENWPDQLREEIQSSGLLSANIAVPADLLEKGLRQGRIVFVWSLVRSWLTPAPTDYASPHDTVEVEFPLSFVAPLFLQRKRAQPNAQQKVSVDEDIPNLFFGFPQPDAPKGTGAKPEDSNFYEKLGPDGVPVPPGTSHTKLGGKHLTPNEVVSRAATLPGVAGTIIALPDGLMVASRLAPDVNGETLAAFLPAIFGKVSQCTKELRMGELNNLNFTVGNVPWKIFRVNAIFFAAYGRAEEPLPSAQLAALAAELNHKPK